MTPTPPLVKMPFIVATSTASPFLGVVCDCWGQAFTTAAATPGRSGPPPALPPPYPHEDRNRRPAENLTRVRQESEKTRVANLTGETSRGFRPDQGAGASQLQPPARLAPSPSPPTLPSRAA